MPTNDIAGRAKLIVNPVAGKMLESSKILEQVIRCLSHHGIPVDVALAHPTKEAAPIARKAVKNGYSTVIAMGGDGTISAVIRGMAGSDAHLGIIAVGTPGIRTMAARQRFSATHITSMR